jgi:hypothetical protein
MSMAMAGSTSPSVASAPCGRWRSRATSGSEASADPRHPLAEAAVICKEAALNQQNEAERNNCDDQRVFDDLRAVFFSRQIAEEITNGVHMFTYKKTVD